MATSNIHSKFDEEWYLSKYPDVAAAIGRGEVSSAFDHYIRHGKSEGRHAYRMISNPNKVVHIHIPKTAGTSIRGAFMRIEKNVIEAGLNFKYNEALHGGADLITGHIGYSRAKDCNGKLITILRDPVDRFLSYYFHLSRTHQEGAEISARTLLAAKYSIDEFVYIDDCVELITDLYNSMTWQLVHENNIDERTNFRIAHGVSDSDIIAIAKENLSKFGVVGFQEHMGAATILINSVFGIELEILLENRNRNRSIRDEINIRTIKRILTWVSLDMEVYQWSLNQLAKSF